MPLPFQLRYWRPLADRSGEAMCDMPRHQLHIHGRRARRTAELHPLHAITQRNHRLRAECRRHPRLELTRFCEEVEWMQSANPMTAVSVWPRRQVLTLIV